MDLKPIDLYFLCCVVKAVFIRQKRNKYLANHNTLKNRDEPIRARLAALVRTLIG